MGATVRDIEAIVVEFTRGRGYVVLEGLFDRDTVAEAPAVERAAVFDASGHVWNLVDKSAVFEHVVQEPTILKDFSRILGTEVRLGSFAAKIVQPGATPQLPHCDYPYFDLNKAASLPMGLNGSYFMNCQATIMLEDFTLDNSATRVALETQVRGRFPIKDEFDRIAVQTTGLADSAMLMTGLLWHCASMNHTDAPRVGILGQYLAKFVTPLEDQRRGVRDAVIARASPELRSLLGDDDPYPQVFDPTQA